MNNLLSQLLINLAQKEVAEKELHATVESLEILVAALIASLGRKKSGELINSIETALEKMRNSEEVSIKSDLDLLSSNIARITDVAKRK